MYAMCVYFVRQISSKYIPSIYSIYRCYKTNVMELIWPGLHRWVYSKHRRSRLSIERGSRSSQYNFNALLSGRVNIEIMRILQSTPCEHIQLFFVTLMVNEKGCWVPRDSLKSQTPESLFRVSHITWPKGINKQISQVCSELEAPVTNCAPMSSTVVRILRGKIFKIKLTICRKIIPVYRSNLSS